MKYLMYLLGIIYISAAIIIAKIFFFTEDMKNPILDGKNKIVIIVPEEKLESFQNNPGGLFNEETGYGIGAGFLISNDGKIQTVNHIVENKNINYKAIYKNKKYDVKVINRDKINDLATLKIHNNENVFDYFNVEKNNIKINNNDIIYSFGIDIDELKIIYNTGTIINKKSKLENKSNLLEISNPLSPGFSGGPIINKDGNVIGINYAISEGKNYGINLR